MGVQGRIVIRPFQFLHPFLTFRFNLLRKINYSLRLLGAGYTNQFNIIFIEVAQSAGKCELTLSFLKENSEKSFDTYSIKSTGI